MRKYEILLICLFILKHISLVLLFPGDAHAGLVGNSVFFPKITQI